MKSILGWIERDGEPFAWTGGISRCMMKEFY